MSDYNTVNKERNKTRKGDGAVSKKDNKIFFAKLKPVQIYTEEVSSSDGEYIVPKAS